MVPLIEAIEVTVESGVEQQLKSHTLYTVSDASLRLIVFDSEVRAIFYELMPVLNAVYGKYFKHELLGGGTGARKLERLLKGSLKSLMSFLKDFGLCPQMLNQRACFLIWFSVTEAKTHLDLTNNPGIEEIIDADAGLGFTLGHLVAFIFRFAVIYFNYSCDNPENFSVTKKVLSLLKIIEVSDAFRVFLQKLNRTYSDKMTFLPSHRTLVELLLNEAGEFEASALHGVPKEELISAIFNGPQELFPHSSPDDKTPSRPIDAEESDAPLRKIFESYCSFGEPMNTTLLKSSKLVKLLREVGLIAGMSSLPWDLQGKAVQVTLTDVDLAFSKVCAQRSPGQHPLSQSMSQKLSLSSTVFQQKWFLKRGDERSTSRRKRQLESSRVLGNRSNSSITSEMSGGDPSRQKGEGNAQNKLGFFEFKRVLIALAMQIFRREEEESYLCLLQTLLGSPTFAQKDELEGNLLSLKDSLKSDPAIRHAGVLVRR